MNKLIRIAMAMIVLCAVASAQPGSLLIKHPQTSQRNTSRRKADDQRATAITGRVVGDAGEPIPNATIRTSQIGKSQNVPHTASADDDGRFRIDAIARGLHNLWVYAPGYVPAEDEPTPRIVRAGDVATITLVKGGVITGTVTNSMGEPMVAIKVRAVLIRDANERAVTNRSVASETQTDDRGVYRIFGLPSGTHLVAASGNSLNYYQPSANEGEAPTYYPSSTRDTAVPVTVRTGIEITGIDIRYRGERGHIISGTVQGAAAAGVDVSLVQAATDAYEGSSYMDARGGHRGFAFYGVADGEYIVTAQRYNSAGSGLDATGRVRVKVKGQDVTGLDITLTPLGKIDGTVTLEARRDATQKSKCESARPAALDEALITSRRDDKEDKGPSPMDSRFPARTAPSSNGEFTLNSLEAGRYHIETQLPSETWYVRALTIPAATATSPPTDAARNGIALKSGERVTLNLTLTEGAASLRGCVTSASEGARLPDHLRVHLVPAEKESADDALRFFEVAAQSDGSFAINNIAPGRYLVVARAIDDETNAKPARPVAWDEAERKRLRQEAAVVNVVIEPQSCQRITDYALKFVPTAATKSPTKNKP